MDPHEEQELEESLDFMRKQFETLTNDIKIPDSLRADLLKKQLELMEAEQEEEERSRRRKSGGKRVLFPMRAVMGFAACVLVVSVSFLSYQLGRASGGALETASSAASSSSQPETGEESPDSQVDAGLPAEAAMEASFDSPAPEGTVDAQPQPAMLQAPAASEGEEIIAGNDGRPLPESAELQAAPAARSVAADDVPVNENGSFNAYQPKTLPEGLALAASAQLENGVSFSYLNEDYSRQIQVTLRPVFPGDAVVDPGSPELYDLRLYTPPYTDSVPEDLATTVNNPVFRAEDLSAALIESRIFDSGGGAPRGNFSVLFPAGVVAELNVTGVSADDVYALVSSMNAS